MSKKIEKIEIRVSPEFKRRLNAHSEEYDQSVSDTVRTAISNELSAASRSGNGEQNCSAAKTRLRMVSVVALTSMVGAIASLSFQGPAIANADVRVAFADMDRNADGVISEEEFDAPSPADSGVAVAGEAQLVHIDDSLPAECETEITSGLLSVDATAPVSDGHDFERFDSDLNAEISFEEFRDRIYQDFYNEFVVLDRNGDARLSPEELTGPAAHEGEAISAGCAEVLFGVAGVAGSSGIEEMMFLERFEFAALDEDRDGSVSFEEFAKQ